MLNMDKNRIIYIIIRRSSNYLILYCTLSFT